MRYFSVKVGSGVLEESFSADAGAPRTVFLIVDTQPASGLPVVIARCDDDVSAAAIRDALNA